VVDWTIYGVGPFAASLLAALGADVVKVEPPAGDPQLSIGPFLNGVASLYLNFNMGKRSIRLDVKDEADKAILWRLVEHADVLLTNFRPGTAAKLGFGEAELAARNPDLVYVDCTGWGELGPMRQQGGADPAVQAFCGWCAITGDEGGPAQLLRYLGHIDLTTSMYIVGAALTGLLARPRVGGQTIRLSMLEAAMAMQSNRLADHLNAGVSRGPLGSAAAVVAPSQAFRCGDNVFVAVSAETEGQWRRLTGALGRPGLDADPRFATNADRVANRHALADELATAFATKPSLWWTQLLARNRVPVSTFWDWDDIRHHPQVRENDHVVLVDTGPSGVVHTGGPPWTFREARAEVTRSCYPGEHTEEIRRELAALPEPSQRDGTERDGLLPLTGLRVVELASGLAGPYCGALLADNGANVTKVELGDGDHLRGWGPPYAGGLPPAFVELNRNKDIVRTGDVAGLLPLLERADVVIVDAVDADGAPPPVAASAVRDANPGVVWCSVSHYGERGELAALPGSELTVQAMSNSWAGLGRPGEPPLRLGADQASMNAGLAAYQGVLAALYRRRRTGTGDEVAVSPLGALLCVKGMHWTSLSNPDDWSGLHVNVWTDPPVTGYRTADLPVMMHLPRVAGRTFDGSVFAALLDRLGARVPDGMRFDAPAGDAAGPTSPGWKPFWENVFAKRGWAELAAVYAEFGGEITPFNTYATLERHPQVAALEPFVALKSDDGAQVRTVRVPWRMSGYPGGLGYRMPAEVALAQAVEER
jgi:crotonobetainyl-CoA:carnitine CoA-transferase CaiB-like acyl-CoA transferase